jgi:hypothetical protein
VVVGASRHAARREVALQSQAASAAEAQRSADLAEQDRRTQLAIDEALAKERREKEETRGKEERREREETRGKEEMREAQSPPQYSMDKTGAADTFYCGACGALSKRGEKFCSHCGRKHPIEEAET